MRVAVSDSRTLLHHKITKKKKEKLKAKMAKLASKGCCELHRKFNFSSGESAVAAGGKNEASQRAQTALDFMTQTNSVRWGYLMSIMDF